MGALPRLVARPVALMRPPESAALGAIIRDLIDTRDGATYFAERVWGSRPLRTWRSHPLVGRSAPDFELEGGTKLGELVRKGNGLLLDFVPGHRVIACKRWGSDHVCRKDAKDRLGLRRRARASRWGRRLGR